jgi:hypothetical protein
MANTFLDLAQLALQHLMVLQDSETVNASDAALALTKMNLILDQWAAEDLTIPAILRTTFSITPSTSSYTVGVGGNVNVTRPEYIDNVTFYDNSKTPFLEMPMEKLTDDMYEQFPYKTMTNVWPQFWWYNRTYAGSLATLILLPVPTSATITGVVYSKSALAQIATLTTQMIFPSGYQNMIVTNLAVALASIFGTEPSPTLVAEAERSMKVVKSRNIRPIELGFDSAALFQSNAYTALDFFKGQ